MATKATTESDPTGPATGAESDTGDDGDNDGAMLDQLVEKLTPGVVDGLWKKMGKRPDGDAGEAPTGDDGDAGGAGEQPPATARKIPRWLERLTEGVRID